MIVGIGLDLVAIARFKLFIERRGPRGLQRIFTQNELDYCMGRVDPSESLAARFAAKEAFYKALGTGVGSGVGWHHAEVTRLASGQPQLVLHSDAARVAQERGVRRVHLTLTHTADSAAALVVLEA